MVFRLKYFICLVGFLFGGLVVLVGILRLQLLQYFVAYFFLGFAHSLPVLSHENIDNNSQLGVCQSPAINVLTYNVQYGSSFIERVQKQFGEITPGDYLPWSVRSPEIRRRITEYKPDLIGLQEMQTDKDINQIVTFDEYQAISFHFAGFEYGDAALLFKKSRFDLLDTGQLWLGPNEDLPFSLGFKSLAMMRYVNWVLLREKVSGFSFLFVNTHFDNNPVNREKSADLFYEKIVKIAANFSIIVTGDFNSNALTDRYKRFTGKVGEVVQLTNSFDLAKSENRSIGVDPNNLIDHILIGGSCLGSVGNWSVDQRPMATTGKYLSDHFPVMAQIKFTGYK